MTTPIVYTCPDCNETFQVEPKKNSEPTSSIPTPGRAITSMQYQDHGDHTYFLAIDESESRINYFQVVPHIRSVFDTLLHNNIEISRIVDTLLYSKNIENKTLLYISDITSFKIFFSELTKKYSHSSEQVSVHLQSDMMIVSRERVVMIISNLESGIHLLKKGKKSSKFLNNYKDIRLKCLVLDTTVISESEIIQQLKKAKPKIGKDVKVILAFNTGKNPHPPIKLNAYLEKKYKLSSLELLNYKDTNGLNSIFLQSYYNLLDNPYEAREIFDLMNPF